MGLVKVKVGYIGFYVYIYEDEKSYVKIYIGILILYVYVMENI